MLRLFKVILHIVPEIVLLFPQVSPAAERLRYILSEDDDMPTPTLFTEMDTLQREGDELEWKESARWMIAPSNKHALIQALRLSLIDSVDPKTYKCLKVCWEIQNSNWI